MKNFMENQTTTHYRLLSLVLAANLALPLPALAASVALATSPLAASTTTTVKPNVVLMMDNSGSMGWDHMPDDSSDGGSAVSFSYGYYGLRSSQCNQVYYNPSYTYTSPIKADGTSYANASFTAAKKDGYDSGSTTVNLNTGFIASESLNPDASGRSAYYYAYSGTQTTAAQKYYHSTSSTFYNECHSAEGASPGKDVFSKRRLATAETTTITISGTVSTSVSGIKVNGVELMSGTAAATTSSSTLASNIAEKITLSGFSATASGSIVTITGPTSAANYTPVITQSGTMTLTADIFPDTTASKLTNFANWYSFYRTRLLMMKTATGHAFSSLDNSYRIGLMKISDSSTPVVALDTFQDCAAVSTDCPAISSQRSNWYTALYGMTTSGSTPLRTALSDAGRYYAGKLSGTDPLQYSCQQNFTILSTDGYWNNGDGFKIDGTTVMDNQDGAYSRPYNDGATTGTKVTITYTREFYSKVTDTCTSGNKKLKTQPQIGSCDVNVTTVTGSESCTPAFWLSNGSATLGTTCNKVSAPSPSTPVAISTVITPGAIGGSSNTLADVAMYYYQTDLRTTALSNCGSSPSNDLCKNNVFTSSSDSNTQQHMTTFTLGLGASGKMIYSPSYLTDTSGDYYAINLGSTATSSVCTWQTIDTTCTWPVPGMTSGNGWIENIDDLWHAAVNGRGAYFSATDPSSLSTGLANALAGVSARKGSAAAAATSTLNPVAGDNFAYVASYTTAVWKGNLEARGINTDTGVVNENATWCVENVVAGTCPSGSSIVAETSGDTTTYNCVTPGSTICTGGVLDGTDCKVPIATACTGTMNAKVSDTTDTRTIKTANSSGTALTNFDATYAAANPSYFSSAHISTLSQWTALTTDQQTAAAGVNLINFLRGQHGYEDRTSNAVANRLYRSREAVLGDALESQPAFIGKPVFSYPYPGYSDFVTAEAGRAGTVYMGANDGMMHAFAADTGIERWAYVPSMVIPNMWKLADKNYASLHINFVNGSPVTSDICTANCNNADYASTPTTSDDPVWKTILVAGLNGGGRGYLALDITDPSTPALLWEFTPTTGIGKVQDDDIGYGFGKAIITKKTDGTWVVLVTSGYNNTSPGDGKGHLYVLNAATGAIISKISTSAGSTGTPSGLAKIAAWNNAPSGNEAGYVYGGDLLGNVWRFDINSTATAAIGTGEVMKFAALFSDAAGTSPQPVTTTPVLGKIADKRVIFIGTGKYLEVSDLTTTQLQTQYAIKDDDATSTLVNPRTSLIQQTLANNPDGTNTRLSTSTNAVSFFSDRGWYIDFPDSGERVNIDSKLVQGNLLVPTIVPSNTACSPGGYGWLNYIDYATGRSINTTTNIISQRYDSSIVGVNVLYIDGKPKVEVVTSADPTPELNPNVPFFGSTASFSGKRVIWRELIP